MVEAMKQLSLSESGFERKTKRTRKREFLEEMNLVSLQASNVGYSRLSLVRALWVVNCQSILALS